MHREHDIGWRAPFPLWPDDGESPDAAPALLRFRGPDPIPALIHLIEQKRERLDGHVARPETWRGAGGTSLKLYQPAHGRSYLAAASLICQVLGLPDRTPDPQTEQVSMVLRRLTPDGHGEEAWIAPREGPPLWTAVGSTWLGLHEEKLDVQEMEVPGAEHPRTIYTGMISVVNDRQAVHESPRLTAAQVEALWQERVFRPLAELLEIQDEGQATLHSTLILCNIALLLLRHQPGLWLYLVKQAEQALTPAEASGRAPARAMASLRPWVGAMMAVAAGAAGLLDPAEARDTPFHNIQGEVTPDLIHQLALELAASLQEEGDRPGQGNSPIPSQPIRQFDPDLCRRYVVRFVYRRELPGCDPVVVLSAASAPFAVASLFDPDAPRQIGPDPVGPAPLPPQLAWRTPALLWERAAHDPPPFDRFDQPALLRFASDQFMDELQDALSGAAPALDHLVAASETRHREDVGWKDWREAASARLKLYQAAHNRYYLVAGTLIDRNAGGKEHPIAPDAADAAFFVIRRLAPVLPGGRVDPRDARSYREEGWEVSGGYGGWQPVAPGDLLETEERLRLYPFGYRAAIPDPVDLEADPATADRWLHMGFVPTGSGDSYQKGPGYRQTLADLHLRVVRKLEHHLAVGPAAGQEANLDAWTALLALADFLHRFLPKVWEQVQAHRPAGAGHMLDRLAGRLVYAWAERARIQRGDRSLRDPALHEEEWAPALLPEMAGELQGLLRKAPPRVDPDQPLLDKYSDTRHYYLLRLVYEETDARGGTSWVLSAPSQPFRLAAFRDRQAPARKKSEQQKQMEKLLPSLLRSLLPGKG